MSHQRRGVPRSRTLSSSDAGRPARRIAAPRPGVAWIASFALAALVACENQPSAPDLPVPEAAAPRGAAVPAGGPLLDRLAPGPDRLRALYENAERTEIADGVAHYRFEVRLGPRPFDVVRIHRVVRERRPGRGHASPRPVRTDGAVFMAHGASLSFEAIFLDAGTEQPDAGTSLAVFLAAHDVDVWGMDFGWGLVPRETSDFTFMRDWGVERDVDHTLAAMSIARWIRATTGQGPAPLHLLGYSYGGVVAYGAAGRETTQRPALRDVGGLVPVDLALRYPTPEVTALYRPCVGAANQRARLDAGDYVDRAGIDFGGLSQLATVAPDDPSPAIPGLTNLQAILFIGANTYLTGPREVWHFVAGDLGEDGIPVGLLYTEVERWIGLGASLPPYMPRRLGYETASSVCADPAAEDVSFDDHLADIRVPVLYLGAQGGFGADGHFTATLTASDDVTFHTVSLQAEERRAVDFGHADLMLAEDAPDLAWGELLRWLVERGGP